MPDLPPPDAPREVKLEWLAEQIDQPWAWRQCDCVQHKWEYVGGSLGAWRSIAQPECKQCHGTGRVAAPLHQPEYTLRLREWASGQRWYGDVAPEETLPQDADFFDAPLWHELIQCDIATEDDNAVACAELVFQRVYAAERAWAEEQQKEAEA